MSRNKKNTKFILQLRVLAIWLILIISIFTLWNVYNPEATSMSYTRVSWPISRVIEASEKNMIVSGVIQSVPVNGPEWYKIYGETKLEKSVQLPNGQTKNTVYFESQGRLTGDRYNKLLNSSPAWREKPSSTIWTEILVSLLPFLIVLALLYFFVGRQLRGAGRTAMGFGRIRAKLLTPDKKKVTFEDVAGCDEAKEEVSDIVDFLKNPKKFKK